MRLASEIPAWFTDSRSGLASLVHAKLVRRSTIARELVVVLRKQTEVLPGETVDLLTVARLMDVDVVHSLAEISPVLHVVVGKPRTKRMLCEM